MDRTQRLAWLWDEVQGVLKGELERELEALCSGDLHEIEGRAQQVLRVVGGALVGGLAQLRLAALAGRPVRCPQCGGAVRYVGARPRRLEGLVGPVGLCRPSYHCGPCGRGVAPLDEAWGLGPGGLSPALARVACRDGIEAAFGKGADLVHENLGVWLDEEQVRGISQALGAVAEADQADPARWALPAGALAPEILALELDGVLLHELDDWREMKGGRVAPLGPDLVVDRASGEAHLALGPSAYWAGREEVARFWPRSMREVRRAGWGRGVRVVVLIADGAEWIWHQARCQLRREGVALVEILDFYHACEHLAGVAAAAFGAGSLRAGDWLDRQRHALRHSGPTPVRRALAKLVPPTAAAADLLRKARLYFRTHAHRMNSPAFRARQFPIGSGAIEGTAKNLVQARLVQAGMRGSTPGAQALAGLRALHRSGRWEAFWRSQPQRRLRLLQPRKPWTRTAPATHTDQPPAEPAARAPVDPVPAAPAAATAQAAPASTRIQTAGKPWAKGKDHWRRSPISHQRSA